MFKEGVDQYEQGVVSKIEETQQPEVSPEAAEVVDTLRSLDGLSSDDLIDEEIKQFAQGVGVDVESAREIAKSEGFSEEWRDVNKRVFNVSNRVKRLVGGVALGVSLNTPPALFDRNVNSQETVNQESVSKKADKDIEDKEVFLDNLYGEAQRNLDKLKQYEVAVMKMNEELESQIVEEMISPVEEVRMHSARLRLLIQKNIERLAKIKDAGIEGVASIGKGVLLFRDYKAFEALRELLRANSSEDLIDIVKETGNGGITFSSVELEKYLISANERGLTNNDIRLIDMLTENNLFVKPSTDTVSFKLNVDSVLFTTDKAFTHENLHRYMLKNEKLLVYWTNLWNSQSQDFRRNFIKDFDFVGLTKEEAESFAINGIEIDQVTTSARDFLSGKESDRRYYQIIQEFFAYSSDNDGSYPPATVPGHEIVN